MGIKYGPGSPALAFAPSFRVSTDSAYSFLCPPVLMYLYDTRSLFFRLKKRRVMSFSGSLGLPSKLPPWEMGVGGGGGREEGGSESGFGYGGRQQLYGRKT